MFSKYGQFDSEGDIYSALWEIFHCSCREPDMFPLAYSAGIVLWNMMQIWDEETNSFLAPPRPRPAPPPRRHEDPD